MNVKTIKKVLSIVLLVIMLMTVASTVVMASTEPSAIVADGSTDTTSIDTAGKKLVGVLQAVGVVLSVVVLIVIGIKYMMGSAEEKAEYKKTFVPYIVGAALIFAASIFAQSVFEFFSGWGQ